MTISTERQSQQFSIVLIASLLAIVAYSIPWLLNPGSSLSLGANDLAEWASIHPHTHIENPSLLTSLLLRLPLACLALIVSFSTPTSVFKSHGWWLGALLVIVIAVALMPPLELLTSARGNASYLQQITLVACVMFGGILGLSGLLSKWRWMAVVIVSLVGIISVIAGLRSTYKLMSDFRLPVQIGLGGVCFAAILIVVIITTWISGPTSGKQKHQTG